MRILQTNAHFYKVAYVNNRAQSNAYFLKGLFEPVDSIACNYFEQSRIIDTTLAHAYLELSSIYSKHVKQLNKAVLLIKKATELAPGWPLAQKYYTQLIKKDKNEEKIQNQNGYAVANTSTNDENNLVLSEADYNYYRQKALQKVDEFVNYLNIITDKKLSVSEKDNAIAQAAKLFMPAATIEVTSNSRPGVRRYPIKDYLTRLKLLPYSSTKIEWSEVQYVNELSQTADGNYYGIITGQQTILNPNNNSFSSITNVIYSDVTKKNVKIRLSKDSVLKDSILNHVFLGSTAIVDL